MEILASLALFGSIAWSIVVLVILLLFLIGSEVENSWSTALVPIVVVAGLFFLGGTPELLSVFTLKNLGMYLGIGFVYSLIRTYFKGRELLVDEKKVYELKSAVFLWWFLFPISIVNWVCGKLIVDLYNVIYDRIGWFYIWLFNGKQK